jgi:putative ABC transport system permease protein
MDTFRLDLRLALRQLRRAPGFSAIVVITLAIGIGANAAIFSAVDAVLLQPLPYRFADRVDVLWNSNQTGITYNANSPVEYYDFKEGLRAYDEVIAIRGQAMTLIGDGAEPEELSVYQVSPNLFTGLGAEPVLGRGFAAEDGAPGAERVVLLSHGLWVRRFGGDREIVGKPINVGGVLRTVVGIMPVGVRFPDAPIGWLRSRGDAWIPWDPPKGDSRGNQILGVLARRGQGVSARTASEDLGSLSARLSSTYRDYYGRGGNVWRMAAVPMRDQMVGSVRPALLVLVGAVGLVLLIACVNVANLLFARGALRQREIALRLALGADRGRIVRQLLTESTLLAVAGGLAGVGLARIGLPLLLSLGARIPRLDGTRVSSAALWFALAISLLTGLAVGVVPGLQQSRTELRDAMAEGTRGSTEGGRRRRLRSGLVAAQMAMALVVLVGAGLLARSFAALQRVEPGFAPAKVLTLQLSLPRSAYDSLHKVTRFFSQLAPDLTQIPGVEQASMIYPVPMGGEGWSGSFDIEGRVASPDEPDPHAEYSVAMPGYFRAVGIPLIEGRDFEATDAQGSPQVAVVDRRLAAKFWPNQTAVGKRINTSGDPNDWITVVGVVGHVYKNGLMDEGEPQLYLPLAQMPQRSMSVVVRTAGPPLSFAPLIRQMIKRHDPNLPTASVRTMDQLLSAAVAPQRFNLVMLGVFAMVALVLASVGLYGVMSYMVSQRTREIGIRIALGGEPGDVRRMVMRESLLIAIGGLAVGGAVSLLLSQLVSRLLFGVSPTDPPTYGMIGGLLLAVAVLAAYGPARRAARVDPLTALRD